MLDKLTDAQIAAMADVRAEWLAHGLSTEPADRDAAVAASRLAYTERGLAEPRIVVWLDSPMAGCMGATMLDQVGDQVGDQVRDQVRDQVGRSMWGQHNAGWYSWIDYWLRHTSITLVATEIGRAHV